MESNRCIEVLDHGYVKFIESYGRGEAGEPEAGIIEAARQSTQGSFRGWEDQPCLACDRNPIINDWRCAQCDGKGYFPGDARLLKYLYCNKPPHATPFEFCGMVIEVQAPILVFREWHRHRTQSYNEMSARYSPLPDKNYMPTKDRLFLSGGKNKQAGTVKGSDELTESRANRWLVDVVNYYHTAEALYQDGLTIGVPKEVARIVLPVGRYSKMRANANLRNWLAFMTLRADPGAQWEIQQYAHAVGRIIEREFPRTWALYVEQRGKV